MNECQEILSANYNNSCCAKNEAFSGRLLITPGVKQKLQVLTHRHKSYMLKFSYPACYYLENFTVSLKQT